MRDPRIEALLNANPNVAWEYVETLGLHQINEQKSFQNQARIGEPVDRDLVLQYQQALRNGDQFPAVVVYEDRPGSYVTIDGNHRYATYKAEKRGVTDAYIVLADNPLERVALTFELNTINGRPTTEQERAFQAVTMVRQGFIHTDVAARLHVSTSFVANALLDYEGLERARTLGVVNFWSRIEAKGIRTRLQSALKLDAPFAEAVRLFGRFTLKQKDAFDLISAVAKLTSEKEQKDELKRRTDQIRREAEKARKDAENKPKRKGIAPPSHTLFDAHLSYFLSPKVDFIGVIRSMTADERQNERKKIDAVRQRLEDIAELLNG